jgi:undecaprenyl-diphosphatase
MQLSLWQLIALAIVQGVTEFLPVSSSGHLVVLAALMVGGDTGALDQLVEVNIVLHVGTLFSILVYYWRSIVRLLDADRRLIKLIFLATVPAVAVGLPLKKYGEAWLSDPLLAGALLPVTGLLLLLGSRFQRRAEDAVHYEQIPWRTALQMGIAQAFAVLPGLSRSGTTITAGLVAGVAPRSAATFSFLMAIPVIAGAGLLEAVDMARGATIHTPVAHLLIAALVSFGVGLASIATLVRILERQRLYWFAWWCIPVGMAVVVWQLTLRWHAV